MIKFTDKNMVEMTSLEAIELAQYLLENARVVMNSKQKIATTSIVMPTVAMDLSNPYLVSPSKFTFNIVDEK